MCIHIYIGACQTATSRREFIPSLFGVAETIAAAENFLFCYAIPLLRRNYTCLLDALLPPPPSRVMCAHFSNTILRLFILLSRYREKSFPCCRRPSMLLPPSLHPLYVLCRRAPRYTCLLVQLLRPGRYICF